MELGTENVHIFSLSFILCLFPSKNWNTVVIILVQICSSPCKTECMGDECGPCPRTGHTSHHFRTRACWHIPRLVRTFQHLSEIVWPSTCWSSIFTAKEQVQTGHLFFFCRSNQIHVVTLLNHQLSPALLCSLGLENFNMLFENTFLLIGVSWSYLEMWS